MTPVVIRFDELFDIEIHFSDTKFLSQCLIRPVLLCMVFFRYLNLWTSCFNNKVNLHLLYIAYGVSFSISMHSNFDFSLFRILLQCAQLICFLPFYHTLLYQVRNVGPLLENLKWTVPKDIAWKYKGTSSHLLVIQYFDNQNCALS